ncbi:hypothetical protein BGX33_000107 [Mortierella sp. NVP41]|nr:hypothetical protein BGX33_000107 [Mortierella sp. NVP41]
MPLVTGQGKPTWTALSTQLDAPITLTIMHPLCVTADNTTVLYLYDSKVARYTIANNTWSSTELIDPKGDAASITFQKAVVDPKTGFVYIPDGHTLFLQGTSVLVYDPSSKAVSNFKMFPKGNDEFFEYDAAWSAYRGSMILFGGGFNRITRAQLMVLWEMSPKGIWTKLVAKGVKPITYSTSCMAMAHGGQKLIVFGGITYDKKTLAKIVVNSTYILDVPTYTWSAGPPAPQGRAAMACATAGDYFVVWGGYNMVDDIEDPKGQTLYFNFVTNQWIDEAKINNTPVTTRAMPTVTATPPSSTEPNLNQESSTNNAAAIGGGIAGAVVLGIIIAILILRHRRRSSSTDDISAVYPYGKQGLPYTDESDSPTSGLSLNKDPQWNNPINNPQWNNPKNNHNIASSPPGMGNGPQDASQIPVQVYEESSAPHKYLLNQYNGPQHVSPFVPTVVQSDSHQQQGVRAWSAAPQDVSETPMNPIEDPAEQLALFKAKHEQRLERIQQEREAELQRFREQYQNNIPPGKEEL